MIDTTNDGGPASPTYVSTDLPEHPPEFDTFPGMSLRDWFAGQALVGLSANVSDERFGDLFQGLQGGMKEAKVAYVIADAMLKAREES